MLWIRPESQTCGKVTRRGRGTTALQSAGSSPARVAAVRAVVDAGVAVMGHVGLTPQSISVLGGFRPQGRSALDALQIVRDAKASVAPGRQPRADISHLVQGVGLGLQSEVRVSVGYQYKSAVVSSLSRRYDN